MAEFVTIDLKNTYKQKTDKNSQNIEQEIEHEENQEFEYGIPKSDAEWNELLKQMEADNAASSHESKLSDLELNRKFFVKFYKAVWKEDKYVKRLIDLGTPLMTTLKVLGINRNTNPIFAFLLQDYVKENLLASGLLTEMNNKVLCKAIAKNIISDSQFFKVNDYNIIYCRDLYKKQPTEMFEYLQAQSNNLKVDANSYNDLVKRNNKAAFFVFKATENHADKNITRNAKKIKDGIKTGILSVDNLSATKEITKLNPLDFVNKYIGINPVARASSDKSNASTSVNNINSLIAKIGTDNATRKAVLQFAYTMTGEKEMANAILKQMSDTEARIGTSKAIQFLPNINSLDEYDLKELISKLEK